jgi:hypothetical protein
MRRVAVIVVLPPADPALRDAIVRIRVDDTHRADARAAPVVECRLDGIPDTALRSGRLAVELAFEETVPADRLSLLAHLDLDRDGAVSIGDFVTTEQIALPAGLDKQPIELTVTRVAGTRP